MINEKNVKIFCCEDLSLIENYELAINDTTQTWACHHILGEQYSKKYLKENGLYENRPACEFRFMTKLDHDRLHKKCVPLSEEHKKAIGEALKGHSVSEATKKAIGEAHKGVPLSEAHRAKLSKKILQFTKSGEFIKEWPSMSEAERELGIAKSNICYCCNGKRKYAGGFIWQYSTL